MNDILADETPYWQLVEETGRRLFKAYGYQEIRNPIVEKTELFKRSIGEVTDIVEKEMYHFEDRNGDSLALRPEGTAGCVRALIEHGVLRNSIQRFWYQGPMFRHERPQKGRYRQFHQMGVEAYGMPGPDIDAEHILLTSRFFKALGLEDAVLLQINSLGNSDIRARHRDDLVAFFSAHRAELDEDSLRRLETNPLRILDSKNDKMQSLIEDAPKLVDYLDEESLEHFNGLKDLLSAAGIRFTENPRLVRGLDYYSKTVYEWVSDRLGAQSAVCGGGRYDVLIEQLGGQPTTAVGFAIGLERLIALVQECTKPTFDGPEAYMITQGQEARQQGLVLAERLRDAHPQLDFIVHCGEGSFKSQFKRADKSGARLALIIGEDEAQAKTVTVKFLREQKAQETLDWDRLTGMFG